MADRWQARVCYSHYHASCSGRVSLPLRDPRPIRIRIHICISFSDAAAMLPLQNGVCGAPTKWRRRQRKLLFAAHQINCKLFEQKLLQLPRAHRSGRVPKTAVKTSSASLQLLRVLHARRAPASSALPCCVSRVLWRSSAKFMATFMCRVACAVNTGNAGKKCIINDVINPHAHSPPTTPTPSPHIWPGSAPAVAMQPLGMQVSDCRQGAVTALPPIIWLSMQHVFHFNFLFFCSTFSFPLHL